MPNCQFPAKELLRMRRQLTAQADQSEDLEFISGVMRFVKGTDDLRLTHSEMTGCNCWRNAIAEEDSK